MRGRDEVKAGLDGAVSIYPRRDTSLRARAEFVLCCTIHTKKRRQQ